MSVSNILQLSPEILTEIFQNLELSDRKCVRLSCRSFYNACNRVPITSQEKFVFRNGYCIQEITKTLLSCSYSRLNLEFYRLPVYIFPGKMWTHVGNKVNSLTFYHCLVNHEVFSNVIIHCRNLKCWKIWKDCRCKYLFGTQPSVTASIKRLEELVEKKITRKQLETFEIYINRRDIWASMLKIVFAVFPNLKTLKAFSRYSSGELNCIDSSRFPTFAFTRIINECLKSTNIERLVFDIPSDGSWLKDSSVWDLRLKEFQTSFYHADKILETLYNFFSHQKLLEAVCLTVKDIHGELVGKLLLHIIKECPNLRQLRLDYPDKHVVGFNDYDFNLLLQKRLEYLEFRYFVSCPNIDKLKLPINCDLHTLVLTTFGIHDDNEKLVLITDYYRNLKHLVLRDVTDAMLQAVIKNQTNLKILVLIDVDACTDFGFTGRLDNADPSQPVYSIRRLTNLQCLIISGSSERITEVTLSEFVLPKLEELHFSVKVTQHSEAFAKNFVKIAKYAPLLRTVSIDINTFNFDQLLEFCCQLKMLNTIGCSQAGFHDSDCVKLFRSCPSLRFAMNENILFRINPFTKKITSQSYDNFYIAHSEGFVCFPSSFG